MKLEIISGVSCFGNGAMVGIALQGDMDASHICGWASSASTTAWGRPASTQTLNGRTEAEQIAYLADRWQEWATYNNVQISINRTPRRVKAPF